MKKLLFGAIMLVGTMAFASTGNGDGDVKGKVKKENVRDGDCVHVTHSCGVSYDICNFKGTIEQLAKMVWVRDEVLC